MKTHTKHRKVVLVEIWISCVIYKVVHGVNVLICNELFIVGESIVSLVLHEFVSIVNHVCKNLICWPKGRAMKIVMEEFRLWCGFPNVQGTIKSINVSMLNLWGAYAKDYYYHKINVYNIVAQVVVDYDKSWFIDVCVGLPGGVNDQGFCICLIYIEMHNIMDCLMKREVHKMGCHHTSLKIESSICFPR